MYTSVEELCRRWGTRCDVSEWWEGNAGGGRSWQGEIGRNKEWRLWSTIKEIIGSVSTYSEKTPYINEYQHSRGELCVWVCMRWLRDKLLGLVTHTHRDEQTPSFVSPITEPAPSSHRNTSRCVENCWICLFPLFIKPCCVCGHMS